MVSTMIKELILCSREVPEGLANKNPYLYLAHHHKRKHIRFLSYAELMVRYKSKDLIPEYIRLFIEENDLVVLIVHMIRTSVCQVIFRSVRDKSFLLYRQGKVPFYGVGYLPPDFIYGQPILLVEGALDCEVARFFHPSPLAVLTNTLSSYQVQFLKTLTNKVILGLDNDKAGREGTERTKSLLKKEGFYIQEIQYPNGMKDLGDLIRYEMNDSAKYGLYKSIISQQIKYILF